MTGGGALRRYGREGSGEGASASWVSWFWLCDSLSQRGWERGGPWGRGERKAVETEEGKDENLRRRGEGEGAGDIELG